MISVFDWQASSVIEGIDGQIVGLSGIVSRSWSLFRSLKHPSDNWRRQQKNEDSFYTIILKIESFQLYIVFTWFFSAVSFSLSLSLSGSLLFWVLRLCCLGRIWREWEGQRNNLKLELHILTYAHIHTYSPLPQFIQQEIKYEKGIRCCIRFIITLENCKVTFFPLYLSPKLIFLTK